MKNRAKTVIKVIVFVILAIGLIRGMNRLLVAKASEIVMMDEYLSLEPDMVDVLCVGSSLAYTSCNTEVLWNEYGIPAFCISGPNQTVAYSYYYIKEALRTQKPKVILLEAAMLGAVESDYEYGNVVNIVWMPYDLNRYETLNEAVYQEYQEGLAYNIRYFHNRWRELTSKDTDYLLKRHEIHTKGFAPWWNYEYADDSIEIWNTDYCYEPGAESQEYVDKIIKLCENNDIILVPYLSARYMDEPTYGVMNWYRNYFAEKGIGFVDGIQLVEELQIDPEIDNANLHMSYYGAVKMSEYIGRYLTEKGFVSDRRGDSRYENWYPDSHYYEDTEDIQNLVNERDGSGYLEALKDLPHAIVLITCEKTDGRELSVDESVDKSLHDIGIRFDNSLDEPYLAIIQEGNLIFAEQSGNIVFDGTLQCDSEQKIYIDFGENRSSCLINYKRVLLNTNREYPAVKIYVYNTLSGEIAQARRINLENGALE